jgi:PAS domain S-box-containing protein
MKHLNHTFTDIENLNVFMREHALTGHFCVQIFSPDEAQANAVLTEIISVNANAKVDTIVSSQYDAVYLHCVLLPDDAEVKTKPASSEFDFFHTGPVVIFKRKPSNDCWAVSQVTDSVSQWGYTPDFFLNDEEAVKGVFHEDDMENVRESLKQAIESDANRINQQYRIKKTDGTVAWVSDYTQIIRDSKGNPIELIGYLVDITKDKDNEALYANIINTTAEGFWLLDSGLIILDVNYSLCAMLGYTKDEMIGKNPFDFIHSDKHNLCKEQVDLIDDVSNRIYELAFETKKGNTVHMLTNATTMYDQYGNIKTFAFMTDISKQKKIEEDLRKRQDKIEEINDSLESRIQHEVEKNREKDQMMYQQSRLASMGEMIGNIAHQWRQPLNIMALVMQDIYISDQLGNLTSEKIEASYEKSNNLLQYMSQTIDDFRNFFQHGGEKSEFSIKEALESVHNLVSTNLAYNHIQCMIEVRQDSIIQGGLNEFKQVLINILNNAQEAIQSNASLAKEINILITQEDENAIISVKDDGGGIQKELINRIFDPYFTTKNQTQGTGLGLYMSKQIIENSMCGSLAARNIKNGAEFIISIPIKKENN